MLEDITKALEAAVAGLGGSDKLVSDIQAGVHKPSDVAKVVSDLSSVLALIAQAVV